jgi:hypothetical protein
MTADPVKIFVGCPASNEDLECQAVLEYSIRKNTTRDVAITWMMLSRDPNSFWYSDPQARKGWNTKTWATPFSPLRWGIPAACNYEGRAIYMDSDQIAMADMGELWDQSFPAGKSVLAKGLPSDMISCVMLFDCAGIRKHLPPIEELKTVKGRYRDVRRDVKSVAANYRGNWNCRDGEGYKSIFDPDIKVLHYTKIPTQPNHKHARARLKAEGKSHWYPGPDLPHERPEFNELFDRLLKEAIAAGYPPERYRVSPEFGDYGR